MGPLLLVAAIAASPVLDGYGGARWGMSSRAALQSLETRFRLKSRPGAQLAVLTGDFGRYRDCDVLVFFLRDRLVRLRFIVETGNQEDSGNLFYAIARRTSSLHGPIARSVFDFATASRSRRFDLAPWAPKEGVDPTELDSRPTMFVTWRFSNGARILEGLMARRDDESSGLFIDLDYVGPQGAARRP